MFREWAEVYFRIISAKPISGKTKANRRSSVRHLLDVFGERTLSLIKPYEIAELIMALYADHEQEAKRVLIEAKDMFGEAVNYGWLDRNPAAPVRCPSVHILRKRLSLDQWKAIHDHALLNMQPWVCRMMVLALVTGQRRSDLCRMRFADVWDGHLHIAQVKTGARIALPLALRLDGIGVTLGQAIEDCRGYFTAGDDGYLLRKHNGTALDPASMSVRFEEARNAVFPEISGAHPPSLHECRSLSERLYRRQGIDTMRLLGHKHQAMTDLYDDDRGLNGDQWKFVTLAGQP